MQAIQQELGERTSSTPRSRSCRKRLDEADLPDEAREEARRELAHLERMPAAAPRLPAHAHLRRVADRNAVAQKHRGQPRHGARPPGCSTKTTSTWKRSRTASSDQLAVLKLNPAANAPILCFVGPPRRRQDLARQVDRALAGAQVRAHEPGGCTTKPSCAATGAPTSARCRAGSFMPPARRRAQTAAHARRGGQAGPTTGAATRRRHCWNARTRRKLRVPRQLPEPAVRPVPVFFITTATRWTRSPARCWTAWRSSAWPAQRRGKEGNRARRYLVERQVAQSGHKPIRSKPDDTVRRSSTATRREAGVRELNGLLGRLCRKVARRFARAAPSRPRSGPTTWTNGSGPSGFFEEDARQDSTPAFAIGLAYTPVGGVVLYIEALKMREGSELTLTGQLRRRDEGVRSRRLSYNQGAPGRVQLATPSRRRAHPHPRCRRARRPRTAPRPACAGHRAGLRSYLGKPMRRDTAMTARSRSAAWCCRSEG